MTETGDTFRARWAAVNAVQDQEVRQLSTAERFSQLEELFAFRRQLGKATDAGELAAIRRRWRKLRRRLRASG